MDEPHPGVDPETIQTHSEIDPETTQTHPGIDPETTQTRSDTDQPTMMNRQKKMKTTQITYGDVVTIGAFSHKSLEEAYHVSLMLSKPDPDEECPIGMDKMSSCDLEILPGVTYLENSREHRKMTLPCGHAFSAMEITYHFAKSHMRCPLCRAGSDQPLHPTCIPAHFKKDMLAHISRVKSREQEETEREDYNSAVQTVLAEYGRAEFIVEVYNFVVTVYAFSSVSDAYPALVMEFPCEANLVDRRGAGSSPRFRRGPEPLPSPPMRHRVVPYTTNGVDLSTVLEVEWTRPEPAWIPGGDVNMDLRVSLPLEMSRRLRTTMASLEGFTVFRMGVGARNGRNARTQSLDITSIMDMSNLPPGISRFVVLPAGGDVTGGSFFELTLRGGESPPVVEHLCWNTPYYDFLVNMSIA